MPTLAISTLPAFKQLLQVTDQALGLDIAATSPDITQKQRQLIQQRETARAVANYSIADNIRNKLLKQGIALKDTAQGVVWQRTKLVSGS